MTCEAMIAHVLRTRDAAHAAHWRTKSYAAHMALGAFYADVLEALDALVEAKQGLNGLIKDLPEAEKPKDDIVIRLNEDVKQLAGWREVVTRDVPALQNLYDALVGVYLTALYKLENLK